jgi:hypothetical protein
MRWGTRRAYNPHDAFLPGIGGFGGEVAAGLEWGMFLYDTVSVARLRFIKHLRSLLGPRLCQPAAEEVGDRLCIADKCGPHRNARWKVASRWDSKTD